MVRTLLASDDVPLLTLTGPGGVGKTRLAVAAAEAEAEGFADGVRFVDLTPIAAADLVMPAIARGLDVREGSGSRLDDALADYLHARSLLLLLDNSEHVLGAAAAIDELLAASPNLKILTTSREPLRLRREQVVEVAPLAVPDPGREDWSLPELAEIPSVAFFTERAHAADASFSLTEQNAGAVAELSRRLDGLPLALELAAARTRLLEPAALVARVEHGLSLLRWDAPDLPPRQRTLRATLDWSHALLTEEEQALFRRLGVFVDGFSLDAAAAVADDEDQAVEPLEILAALADKHLIRGHGTESGEPRFSLLATVREYALAQLAASNEEDDLRRRHAMHYLALLEEASEATPGAGESAWLQRLGSEHANIQSALEWAIRAGEAEIEWRIVAAMKPCWIGHGRPREGLARIEAALSRDYTPPPALNARLLEVAGTLAEWSGNEEAALAWSEQGLEAARAAGDTARMARLLGVLGRLAYARGEAARARDLAADMLALAHQVDDGVTIGMASLNFVLFAIGAHGTPGERERLLQEIVAPIALLREAGANRFLALLLAGEARMLADADPAAALAPLRESLELAQELEDSLAITFVPWLAAVLLAERLPAERLTTLTSGVASLIEREVAGGRRNTIATFAAPADHATLERTTAEARQTLGDEGFAAAAAAGRTLSFAAVIDEALTVLDAAEQPSLSGADASAPPTPREAGLLSPRERDVLALVAEGRSNKDIAEALYVSPNTVKTHVASLLNKLSANTRSQLAAIALRQGLA